MKDNKIKLLREEANIKTDTEENGNFIYVVRGMPWERHIVKIKVKRDQTERDQTPEEEACSQYKLQELKLRVEDSNPSIIAISEVIFCLNVIFNYLNST